MQNEDRHPRRVIPLMNLPTESVVEPEIKDGGSQTPTKKDNDFVDPFESEQVIVE